MRTIISLQSMEPRHIEQIQEIAPDWQIISGKVSDIDPIHLDQAEILLSWHGSVAEQVLKPDAKLRWIQVWSAGIDNLPLDALEQRNIYITDASGVHPHPMSETALAMMLGLTRNFHRFARYQMNRTWSREGHVGEMHGKTVGIIGVGEIGAEIARLCKAFGMRVLGMRRSGKPVEHVDQMVDPTGMGQVLAESDYVVNILPNTDETKHLIDETAFAQMKPNAFYINIGRGSTTKTDALIRAIESRQIAGAGLDVMEQEPLPSDHPLWTLDNVIITPHIGGVHDDYHERMMQLFLENLKAYLEQGMPGRNVVDYSLRY